MWGVLGAGFGALIKTAAIFAGIVMIILGLVAVYEGRQLQMWLYFGGAAVVIGMGLGAWKLLSECYQYDRRRLKSDAQGSSQLITEERISAFLVFPGLVGVVFWMAVGAVLALGLMPFFPAELTEWVDRGREWAVTKLVEYEAR